MVLTNAHIMAFLKYSAHMVIPHAMGLKIQKDYIIDLGDCINF